MAQTSSVPSGADRGLRRCGPRRDGLGGQVVGSAAVAVAGAGDHQVSSSTRPARSTAPRRPRRPRPPCGPARSRACASGGTNRPVCSRLRVVDHQPQHHTEHRADQREQDEQPELLERIGAGVGEDGRAEAAGRVDAGVVHRDGHQVDEGQGDAQRPDPPCPGAKFRDVVARTRPRAAAVNTISTTIAEPHAEATGRQLVPTVGGERCRARSRRDRGR
jgi:hypothetical protein